MQAGKDEGEDAAEEDGGEGDKLAARERSWWLRIGLEFLGGRVRGGR